MGGLIVILDEDFVGERRTREEERRKREEVEAARAMEDTGFDDPIEPEDPTDVRIFSFYFHFCSTFIHSFVSSRYRINVNLPILTKRKI